MIKKIKTSAVKAEIDTGSGETVITVTRPHIRHYSWNITLKNGIGAYADYAGGCDTDQDAQTVLDESMGGLAWYWNMLDSDPERMILHAWGELCGEIERSADDAANGLFELFSKLVDPEINGRDSFEDPNNVKRYARIVSHWQAVKVASAVKWHWERVRNGAVPNWADLRRDLPALLATEYALDMDAQGRIQIALYNPTVTGVAGPLDIEISGQSVRMAWKNENDGYAFCEMNDAALWGGGFANGGFIAIASKLHEWALEAHEMLAHADAAAHEEGVKDVDW